MVKPPGSDAWQLSFKWYRYEERGEHLGRLCRNLRLTIRLCTDRLVSNHASLAIMEAEALFYKVYNPNRQSYWDTLSSGQDRPRSVQSESCRGRPIGTRYREGSYQDQKVLYITDPVTKHQPDPRNRCPTRAMASALASHSALDVSRLKVRIGAVLTSFVGTVRIIEWPFWGLSSKGLLLAEPRCRF